MIIFRGMKRGNQVDIIKRTVSFRENADFLPIGLALLGNRGKTSRKSGFNCPYCNHIITNA